MKHKQIEKMCFPELFHFRWLPLPSVGFHWCPLVSVLQVLAPFLTFSDFLMFMKKDVFLPAAGPYRSLDKPNELKKSAEALCLRVCSHWSYGSKQLRKSQ